MGRVRFRWFSLEQANWTHFWKQRLLLCFVSILGLSLVLYSRIALTQPPIHVAMLTSALDAAQGQSLVAAFEAENPDIKIDVVEGPNASNAIEDLYTSSFLLGDSPYDLVMMDVVWLPKFAAAGWLLDLTDRIPAADLADFTAADLAGGQYNGRLYRLPIRSDVQLLFYRKDWLEQAGLPPPQTFADLITISQQLQAAGIADWGYVWQGRQFEGLAAVFVDILAGFGGFWVNPDTLEVGLDRPEAVQAVNFLRNTLEQGISPPGVTSYQHEDARRLFQSGKVVFMHNWPYAYPLGNADDSPIRGRFDIKPMVHAPGATSASCLGGWGIGIAKTTAHPEAALRVAQFYASVAAQRQSSLENGYLPTRRSLYSDPELVARYPYLPDMLKVVEGAVLRPPIAQYAQASDILQRYLSSAISNRLPATQAMRSAAEETRALLKRYGRS
ncbi:MAG: ABC transporter substrate-binding protein [Synechococcales cyanobacterium C42_A2020_086]|jgi:multiple sugar transport system substrate-binding protein|nr:ABC transporter substrate-binding protein [Synechococcales cyanobacterium C42_A2020_086]